MSSVDPALLEECRSRMAAGVSRRRACRELGLSEASVRRYERAAANAVTIHPHGGISSLPPSLSEEIATVARAAGKYGFGLSKKELRGYVGYLVEAYWDSPTQIGQHLRRYCRFVDHVPGDEWVEKFFRDNNLSLVKPSPLQRCRANALTDPAIIFEFYDLLESEIDRLGLRDKPKHFYNLDESAFFLDPTRGNVVVAKGEQNVHRVTSGGGDSVLVSWRASRHVGLPNLLSSYSLQRSCIPRGMELLAQ
jgi:hypothetical protein